MIDLQFDPVAHRYTVGGRAVPSVTTIMKPLFDFSGISPEVLARKAELGTAVHTACELDDCGDLDESSLHESVVPYLNAYRSFKASQQPEVIYSELRVYNEAHGYAGTLDLFCAIRGVLWLIDIKTTAQISPATGIQTAAYLSAMPPMAMLMANKVRRAALQLKPDGSFKLQELTGRDDFSIFVSLLNIHNWKERNLK